MSSHSTCYSYLLVQLVWPVSELKMRASNLNVRVDNLGSLRIKRFGAIIRIIDTVHSKYSEPLVRLFLCY